MIKVALTGNIASGKSTVEKILINNGFKVFDTDKIAHQILNSNAYIKSEFKDYNVIVNNKIDRVKLGELVFNDKNLLTKLENIIHPLVKNEIFKIFIENNSEKVIFVSVPQLFEAGFEKMFDKIIYVYSKEEIRLERLMKRNNYTIEYAKKRIDAQQRDELKISKSDFIINNNTDTSNLETEINKIVTQIL